LNAAYGVEIWCPRTARAEEPRGHRSERGTWATNTGRRLRGAANSSASPWWRLAPSALRMRPREQS